MSVTFNGNLPEKAGLYDPPMKKTAAASVLFVTLKGVQAIKSLPMQRP